MAGGWGGGVRTPEFSPSSALCDLGRGVTSQSFHLLSESVTGLGEARQGG